MGILSQISYFKGRPGHEFVLVFSSELRPVTGLEKDLYTLSQREDFVGLVQKAPKTQWGGMHEASGDTFYLRQEYDTAEAAADALRVMFKMHQEELAKLASDPVYALEKALHGHDWYAHYSDDHSVYAASERHWRHIESFKDKVGADTFNTLVEKYKPKR